MAPMGFIVDPIFNLERSLKTTYQRLTPSGPLLQSGSEAQPRALLRQRLCLVLWTLYSPSCDLPYVFYQDKSPALKRTSFGTRYYSTLQCLTQARVIGTFLLQHNLLYYEA